MSASPQATLPSHRKGILFVLSAPSGGGKSTLLQHLRPFADFQYSVSCTTRSPRSGEQDGVDYHFLSRTAFEEEIAQGNLLEWAEVHGNYYGTRRDRVVEQLQQGIDVLLDLDVQGARAIRHCADPVITAALVDVFLTPPSLEILHRRLRARATETEAQLALRLHNATTELACWHEYAYLLLSGAPEEDVRQFRCIMESERMRTARLLLPPTLA